MTLQRLVAPFPWERYSKKLARRIEKPHSFGVFTVEDAQSRGMHLAVGASGDVVDGNCISFHCFVDPEDGVIADARFQVFGQSALIGAAEAICELIVGKNYDQARRLSAIVVDQHLRDKSGVAAFPPETYPHINLALEALDRVADACMEIPLAENYVALPLTGSLDEVVEGGYPGWTELSLAKKLAVIEEVMDRDIRPYIALDAGGVEVKKLEENTLTIAYQGNCTSCLSSVGATLSYIQQMLRNKVHPELCVTPELPFYTETH